MLWQLCEAIHRKRPGNLLWGESLQHYHVTPHSTHMTQELLPSFYWVLLVQPSYKKWSTALARHTVRHNSTKMGMWKWVLIDGCKYKNLVCIITQFYTHARKDQMHWRTGVWWRKTKIHQWYKWATLKDVVSFHFIFVTYRTLFILTSYILYYSSPILHK